MREYSKDNYEHNKKHIAEMRGIAAQISDPLHKKALDAIIDALEAQVQTAYALAVERDELLEALKKLESLTFCEDNVLRTAGLGEAGAATRALIARIEAAA